MADYDKLTIKIMADTSSAIAGIKTLSSRLEELEKQAKKMDLTRLKKIEKILRDIAKIDFTRVSTSLYSVAKSFETLSSVSSKAKVELEKSLDLGTLAETSSASIKKVAERAEDTKRAFTLTRSESEKFLKELNRFNEVKGLDFSKKLPNLIPTSFEERIESVKNAFKGLQETFNNNSVINPEYDKLEDTLSRIGLNGKQVESVISAIHSESSRLSDAQLNKIESALKRLGYSAKEVKQTMAKLTGEINKAGGNASKGIQKVALKVKSLALYRLIRLVLMKIQQALSEAMQSLAEYDDNFNQSMGSIMSSFEYLAKSIVAFISPIIQVLEPIVTFVVDAIAELVNLLGSTLSSALGNDTFTEAQKDAKTYLETLGKVKNATLGIDELNVISPDKQSSWDTKGVDATGKLGDTIKGLAEQLKPITDAIKEIVESEEFQELVKTIAGLVTDLIKSTSEDVNGSVLSLVEMFGQIIKTVSDLLSILKPILNIGNQLNSLILNLINGILSELFTIIGEIVGIWGDIIAPFLESLVYVLNIILPPLVALLNIVKNMVTGVLSVISTALKSLHLIIDEVINFFKTGEFDTQIFETISKAFESVFTKIAMNFILAVDNFVRAILGGIDKIGSFFHQDWGLVDNYGGGWAERTGWDFSAVQGKTETPSVENKIVDNWQNLPAEKQNAAENVQVNVYLDSDEIASHVEKIQDNRGSRTFTGGTLTYGK